MFYKSPKKKSLHISTCFLKQWMAILGKDKMGNYKATLKAYICGDFVLQISKSADKG